MPLSSAAARPAPKKKGSSTRRAKPPGGSVKRAPSPPLKNFISGQSDATRRSAGGRSWSIPVGEGTPGHTPSITVGVVRRSPSSSPSPVASPPPTPARRGARRVTDPMKWPSTARTSRRRSGNTNSSSSPSRPSVPPSPRAPSAPSAPSAQSDDDRVAQKVDALVEKMRKVVELASQASTPQGASLSLTVPPETLFARGGPVTGEMLLGAADHDEAVAGYLRALGDRTITEQQYDDLSCAALLAAVRSTLISTHGSLRGAFESINLHETEDGYVEWGEFEDGMAFAGVSRQHIERCFALYDRRGGLVLSEFIADLEDANLPPLPEKRQSKWTHSGGSESDLTHGTEHKKRRSASTRRSSHTGEVPRRAQSASTSKGRNRRQDATPQVSNRSGGKEKRRE
eukprot:Sspe_Gene.109874::Locus_90103_Transcript_1_1_Confidence_1.000_Length_1252::g.109874::m.109874